MTATIVIVIKKFLFCCLRSKACALCKIPAIFEEFEKDFDIFQYGFYYLKNYHAQLVPFLIQIFDVDKTAYECF